MRKRHQGQKKKIRLQGHQVHFCWPGKRSWQDFPCSFLTACPALASLFLFILMVKSLPNLCWNHSSLTVLLTCGLKLTDGSWDEAPGDHAACGPVMCATWTFPASADIIWAFVCWRPSYQNELKDDQSTIVRGISYRRWFRPCSGPPTESCWDVVFLIIFIASLEWIHHMQPRSRGNRAIALESYKISPYIFLPPHCGGGGLHLRTLLL